MVFERWLERNASTAGRRRTILFASRQVVEGIRVRVALCLAEAAISHWLAIVRGPSGHLQPAALVGLQGTGAERRDASLLCAFEVIDLYLSGLPMWLGLFGNALASFGIESSALGGALRSHGEGRSDLDLLALKAVPPHVVEVLLGLLVLLQVPHEVTQVSLHFPLCLYRFLILELPPCQLYLSLDLPVNFWLIRVVVDCVA